MSHDPGECECGPCYSCVFWEKQSGRWGRCWAPESDGESLGLIIEGNGILLVRDDFCCSAYVETDEATPGSPPDGEDDDGAY